MTDEIDVAREAYAKCQAQAQAAEQEFASAQQKVTDAEAAFEAEDSESAWQQVQAVRVDRDRTELLARQTAKRAKNAEQALAEAERAIGLQEFEEASAAASGLTLRAAIEPDLAELMRLDQQMLAIAKRVFDQARAQSSACHRAQAIADRIGIQYYQQPIPLSSVRQMIGRALGAARSVARAHEDFSVHPRELDGLLAPERPDPSGPHHDYFREIATQALADGVLAIEGAESCASPSLPTLSRVEQSAAEGTFSTGGLLDPHEVKSHLSAPAAVSFDAGAAVEGVPITDDGGHVNHEYI